jgi:hypothetical protein
MLRNASRGLLLEVPGPEGAGVGQLEGEEPLAATRCMEALCGITGYKSAASGSTTR